MSSSPAAHSSLAPFAACSLCALALMVASVLWYFKSPSVGVFMSVFIFGSWLLGISGLVLLPADLGLSVLNGGTGPHARLDQLWEAVYWSTFVLSWVVLPVMLQFFMAGNFSFRGRLGSALRENIRFYLVCLVLGCVIVIFAVASNISPSDVLGFLIAYGNTYGMMFIILLLGNGLVALPRRLWEMSFPALEVERLELIAPHVDEELYDAMFELEDRENEVKHLKALLLECSNAESAAQRLTNPSSSRESVAPLLSSDPITLSEHMDTLLLVMERFEYSGSMKSTSHLSRTTKDQSSKPLEVNIQTCVLVHKNLLSAQARMYRAKRRFDTVLEQYALATDDAELRVAPPAREVTHAQTLVASLAWSWLWVRYIWRTRIKNYFWRGLSVSSGCLSVLILWSELTVMVAHPNMSPIGLILQLLYSVNKHRGTVTADSASMAVTAQILSSLPLLYMGICTYWSAFRLKFTHSYTLVGPGLSAPPSLLFNAQLCVRLQFPLCFNYLLLLKYQHPTAFKALMADMRVVPILGTTFNVYAPLVLVLIAAFTFFHVFSRLLKMLGLDIEDAVTVGQTGDAAEKAEARARGRQVMAKIRGDTHIHARRRVHSESPGLDRDTDGLELGMQVQVGKVRRGRGANYRQLQEDVQAESLLD